MCVRARKRASAFKSNIDAIGFVQNALKAHNPFGLNCKNWPRPSHVWHYHLALTFSLSKHTHTSKLMNLNFFFMHSNWNLYHQFTWIVFSTRTKTARISTTLDWCYTVEIIMKIIGSSLFINWMNDYSSVCFFFFYLFLSSFSNNETQTHSSN